MRTRLIHSKMCESEQLAALSDAAERLFFRLISKADDAGRSRADPALVAGLCWPTTGKTVKETAASLNELERGGLLRRYMVKGITYLELTGFSEHQKFRNDRRLTILHPPWQPPDNQVETSGIPPDNHFNPIFSSPISSSPNSVTPSSTSLGSVGQSADAPAHRILELMNELGGRHFEHTPTQLRYAERILKHAGSLERAEAVIRDRSSRVRSADDRKFFRPSTFAVPGNFETYAEEMASGVTGGAVSKVTDLEQRMQAAHDRGVARMKRGNGNEPIGLLAVLGPPAHDRR